MTTAGWHTLWSKRETAEPQRYKLQYGENMWQKLPVSVSKLAVSTRVILSFKVFNIQQSKNGFVTLEIYQMRSVSTFQRCTI